MFSGKNPMQISAKPVAAKVKEPIFPIQLFPRYVYKPNMAKKKAKKPLLYNPKLKTGPVMPTTIPKSLSALFAQLNCG